MYVYIYIYMGMFALKCRGHFITQRKLFDMSTSWSQFPVSTRMAGKQLTQGKKLIAVPAGHVHLVIASDQVTCVVQLQDFPGTKLDGCKYGILSKTRTS